MLCELKFERGFSLLLKEVFIELLLYVGLQHLMFVDMLKFCEIIQAQSFLRHDPVVMSSLSSKKIDFYNYFIFSGSNMEFSVLQDY